MIKLYNNADFLFDFQQAGNYTAAANLSPSVIPFSGFLIGVYVAVGTAGVGTPPANAVDILQNEVSIYGGTKITLTAASRFATYVAPAVDPPPVVSGDVFTLKLSGSWGTTASVDLAVTIAFRRRYQSPPSASYQGNFGLDIVYYG